MLYGRLPTTRSARARRTRQGGDVDRQHVGLDHVERRVAAQARGEIAIELDHRQPLAAFEQRQRQRAASGTDLDQRVARLRIDRGDDPVDHRQVDEEVLAEALSGVWQERPPRRCAGRYCGGSRSSM